MTVLFLLACSLFYLWFVSGSAVYILKRNISSFIVFIFKYLKNIHSSRHFKFTFESHLKELPSTKDLYAFWLCWVYLSGAKIKYIQMSESQFPGQMSIIKDRHVSGWSGVRNLSFITNNHGVHPLFLCFYWFTQSYSTRLDWVMEVHHKEGDVNAYWLLWRKHNRKFAFSVNQTPFMSGMYLYCFHSSFISVLFSFYCWSHSPSTSISKTETAWTTQWWRKLF